MAFELGLEGLGAFGQHKFEGRASRAFQDQQGHLGELRLSLELTQAKKSTLYSSWIYKDYSLYIKGLQSLSSLTNEDCFLFIS